MPSPVHAKLSSYCSNILRASSSSSLRANLLLLVRVLSVPLLVAGSSLLLVGVFRVSFLGGVSVLGGVLVRGIVVMLLHGLYFTSFK